MDTIIKEVLEMHDSIYEIRTEIGRLRGTKEIQGDSDLDALMTMVIKLELSVEKIYTDAFEASDKTYFDDEDSNFIWIDNAIVEDFDGDLTAIDRFYYDDEFHSSMDLDKS